MTPHDSDAANEAGDFSYRATKDGRVLVDWHGKTVTTLQGKEARTFLARVSNLDARGAQLVMARVTGNFKRGNERRGGSTSPAGE